ncbi:hypothetical protein QJS66_06445 [Kocuria rhizophila]|nr:hypothetical protein QJS66_06445 [Kocuria rhizophila]
MDAITGSCEPRGRGAERYPDRDFTALRKALAYLPGGAPGRAERRRATAPTRCCSRSSRPSGGPGVLSSASFHVLHVSVARAGNGHRLSSRGSGRRLLLSRRHRGRQVAEHAPSVVFLCSPNNPAGPL